MTGVVLTVRIKQALGTANCKNVNGRMWTADYRLAVKHELRHKTATRV